MGQGRDRKERTRPVDNPGILRGESLQGGRSRLEGRFANWTGEEVPQLLPLPVPYHNLTLRPGKTGKGQFSHARASSRAGMERGGGEMKEKEQDPQLALLAEISKKLD